MNNTSSVTEFIVIVLEVDLVLDSKDSLTTGRPLIDNYRKAGTITSVRGAWQTGDRNRAADYTAGTTDRRSMGDDRTDDVHLAVHVGQPKRCGQWHQGACRDIRDAQPAT